MLILIVLPCPSPDIPTIDDLLELPFFAATSEQSIVQGVSRWASFLQLAQHMFTSFLYADVIRSGTGLSLEGQQMLQNLLRETSERFSRGAKKKSIKGIQPYISQCAEVFLFNTI